MNLSLIFPLLVFLSVLQTTAASKAGCGKCPMKKTGAGGEKHGTSDSNETDADVIGTKAPADNENPSPRVASHTHKNDAGSKCPMRQGQPGEKKECPFHKIFTMRNIVIGSAVLVVLIVGIVLAVRYSGVCRKANNDHYEIKP